MTDNLFRPEVGEARRDAWLGTTRLPSPRIAWPMALLSLALVACVAAFLFFGHSVRTLRMQGVLAPSPSLHAELWAPGDAIGEVMPGMRVALRYRAFPFRRYGVQSGHVVSVSRAAPPPDVVLPRSGMTADAPAYRVVVALDPQTDRASGRALPLRAGMTVDADLMLERRRLYEAMFFPPSSGHRRGGGS